MCILFRYQPVTHKRALWSTLMPPTPEQAVNLVADRFSRRLFWATIAIIAAAWILGIAAIAAASWQLAGIAALMLVPAAGCALASMAFHSPRLRRDTTKWVEQKKAGMHP